MRSLETIINIIKKEYDTMNINDDISLLELELLIKDISIYYPLSSSKIYWDIMCIFKVIHDSDRSQKAPFKKREFKKAIISYLHNFILKKPYNVST